MSAPTAGQEYRALWPLVQLRTPDSKLAWSMEPHVKAGGSLPAWAMAEDIERLLALGAIEKVEAGA